jgi:hypothetical protein
MKPHSGESFDVATGHRIRLLAQMTTSRRILVTPFRSQPGAIPSSACTANVTVLRGIRHVVESVSPSKDAGELGPLAQAPEPRFRYNGLGMPGPDNHACRVSRGKWQDDRCSPRRASGGPDLRVEGIPATLCASCGGDPGHRPGHRRPGLRSREGQCRAVSRNPSRRLASAAAPIPWEPASSWVYDPSKRSPISAYP